MSTCGATYEDPGAIIPTNAHTIDNEELSLHARKQPTSGDVVSSPPATIFIEMINENVNLA